MSEPIDKDVEPSGHWEVVQRRRGRVIKTYWNDADGRHGKVLGPAHVKDSGRRTARGAVVWRSADGPKPTDDHLTPKDAEAELRKILNDAPRRRLAPLDQRPTLRMAVAAHLDERRLNRGIRRSTDSDYENLTARLYRDLGGEQSGDRPVDGFEAAELRDYFTDFVAEPPVGAEKAKTMKAEGHDVVQVVNEVWFAWPPGEKPIVVATKAEAERIARERSWTWKHRAPGAYRVTPPNSGRPKRVGPVEAQTLAREGWAVEQGQRKHCVVRKPAAASTRNKYRDFVNAVFACAVGKGWIADNPMRDVKRSSLKQDRDDVLRREDFYDKHQVARLLKEVDDPFDEAFFLCGFHGGFRLPGEGLGLRWGAVDFVVGVVRPYDNWVRGALDRTKTGGVAPIPMTPSWRAALQRLHDRGWRTGDTDHVFTRDPLTGRPADERDLRAVFKEAVERAGLPPIDMYNSRHSFGTALAANNVPQRTISGLMRHKRMSTTEIYMAYSPQPELGAQITRALEASAGEAKVLRVDGSRVVSVDVLLDALVDELPPKWLAEVKRIRTELDIRVRGAAAAAT